MSYCFGAQTFTASNCLSWLLPFAASSSTAPAFVSLLASHCARCACMQTEWHLARGTNWGWRSCGTTASGLMGFLPRSITCCAYTWEINMENLSTSMSLIFNVCLELLRLHPVVDVIGWPWTAKYCRRFCTRLNYQEKSGLSWFLYPNTWCLHSAQDWHNVSKKVSLVGHEPISILVCSWCRRAEPTNPIHLSSKSRDMAT